MMKGEVPTFEPHDLQENAEASLSILCPSKKTGMGEKRGVAQPSDQFKALSGMPFLAKVMIFHVHPLKEFVTLHFPLIC